MIRQKVIFNLSSKQLSGREKVSFCLLALTFAHLFLSQIILRYFSAFESYIIRLKSLPLMRNCNFNDDERNVKTIACKYYYGFQFLKFFCPYFY